MTRALYGYSGKIEGLLSSVKKELCAWEKPNKITL